MCGHYFDITDANVVCRELGYPEATRYYTYNYYGPGSGPIWLANLACNGSETSLHYCSHGGIGNTYYYCSHYHDIGVVCKGIILILYVHIHVYYTLQCAMIYLFLLMEVFLLLEQELVTQLHTTVIMDMT